MSEPALDTTLPAAAACGRCRWTRRAFRWFLSGRSQVGGSSARSGRPEYRSVGRNALLAVGIQCGLSQSRWHAQLGKGLRH